MSGENTNNQYDTVTREAEKELRDLADLSGWKFIDGFTCVERELPTGTYGVAWKWRAGMEHPKYYAYMVTKGGSRISGLERDNTFAAYAEAVRFMDEYHLSKWE